MSSETTTIGAFEPTRGDERNAAETTSQYVAFSIGEQDYCIDIMSVREIRTWANTTPLPNTADFVRGVINLRGVILPIVDLRARFGQGETEPTENHVVVIVAVGGRLVGLLVDAVLDILTVQQDEISAVPDTGGEERNPYLDGLVTQNERMVAMIALERLITEAIIQWTQNKQQPGAIADDANKTDSRIRRKGGDPSLRNLEALSLESVTQTSKPVQ